MEDHRLPQYGCEVGSACTRSPIVSLSNPRNLELILAWMRRVILWRRRVKCTTGRQTADIILGGACADGLPPNWLPDNHSFVYGRLQKLASGAPATEVWKKYKTYLHVLGTDPEKDPPVFGYGVVSSIDVDPSLIATVQIPRGSQFALGSLGSPGVSANSAFYVAPVAAIGQSNLEWRKVADVSDGVTSIAVHGGDLYVLTYKDAPRYKILRTDARKPDIASAETIVPPGESVIAGISAAQDALYARVIDGGISRMLRIPYGAKPQVESVVLPFEGSLDLADSDPRVQGTLFSITSWIKATTIFAYDPKTKTATNTRLQPTGPYDDPDVQLADVKVRSYDGTQVPLTIIRPKGSKLDGSNPTWLLGYGAYGNSILPIFQPWVLAWYERGGVLAICHVRGGGEYGEEWHLAGKGPTKPVSITCSSTSGSDEPGAMPTAISLPSGEGAKYWMAFLPFFSFSAISSLICAGLTTNLSAPSNPWRT